jgi:hypothetical protein
MQFKPKGVPMNARWIQKLVVSSTLLLVVSCGGGGNPVSQTPSIKSFSSSLSTINLDQDAVLTWDVANATSVSIQPGIGTVDPTGSVSVSPDSPTTYSLTAKNAAEVTTKELSVAVNPFGTPSVKNAAGVGISAVEVGVANTLIISILVSPPDGQTVSSVSVTKGSTTLALKDSGDLTTDGDQTSADKIYSGKISFTEAQAGAITFDFSIATSAKTFTYPLTLPALVLNADTLTNLDNISKMVDSKFKSFPETTPADQVLAQTKTYLDANATALKIQSTRVSENVLEVIDSAGIHSFFQIGEKPNAAPGASQNLSPTQPAPASTASSSISVPMSALQAQLHGVSNSLGVEPQSFSPDPDLVGNTKALIYAPVTPNLGSADVDAINSTLTNSKLKFDVTVLRDEKADILSLYRLTDYGFIYFATHGTGGEWLQTGELSTSAKDKLNQLDMQSGQIARWEYFYGPASLNSTVKTVSYAVSSKWFATHLYGAFPNSFIYIGSCESLQVQNLSGVFRGMGAGAYFGYTNNVANDFAAKQSSEVTNALVKDLKTAGDTYSLVRNEVDPLSGTKPLVALGNQKLRFGLQDTVFGSWDMNIRYTKGQPIVTCLANFYMYQGEYWMDCDEGWAARWVFNNGSIRISQTDQIPSFVLEGTATNKYMSGTVSGKPNATTWCAANLADPNNAGECTP